MGMIVCTFMLSLSTPGQSYNLAVLTGLLGAMVGSIVSTRLTLRLAVKIYGKEAIWFPMGSRLRSLHLPALPAPFAVAVWAPALWVPCWTKDGSEHYPRRYHYRSIVMMLYQWLQR